jgi:hypothetical protein
MARGSLTSRAVTWLMLAAYVVVVSGVPLPIAGSPPEAGSPAAERLADKDRSRPFPCMDKPCGCATAEQCFSSCCCNSPAELLAWAEAHHLDPATLLALHGRVAATAPEAPAAACCCSSAAEAASCCTTTESAPSHQPAPADEGNSAPSPSRMISLKAMLACGGVLAGWTAAVTSLPPPTVLRCEPCMRLVGVLSITDEIGHSADRLSDTPPPRA